MLLAWHGWTLQIPPRWSPIKIEGDYDRGFVLLVDMHRPRLGVRWQKVSSRNPDPEKLVYNALRNEVGKLAADEARPYSSLSDEFQSPLLYVEPEPPGRDVWTAWSPASKRVIQLIYHARRREAILPQRIIPHLADESEQPDRRWSIFELSCTLPKQWGLQQQVLNAGDLALSFVRKNDFVTVRQVAVAQLALQRLPLKIWLARTMRPHEKRYRAVESPAEVTFPGSAGPLVGLGQSMKRRRRFFFMYTLPKMAHAVALHDEVRDRLVMLSASDSDTLAALIPTIGFAAAPEEPESED